MASAAGENERDAFTLEPVVTNIKDKITALAYHDEYIFVGTSGGALHKYRWNETADGKYESREADSQLLSTRRQAVKQLEVVEELNQLIALCDGRVTVHNLKSLERIEQDNITSMRRVVMFCRNQKGAPTYRLCICVNRSVFLFEFTMGVYVPDIKQQELALPDVPLTMAWYGHNVYVGYKREYNLVNDNTGEVEELSGRLDMKTIPMIKFLPNSELLMARPNKIGVYLTATGEPAQRSTIGWSHPPAEVAYCFPYIISFMPKATHLEVHSFRTQKLVQTIPTVKGGSCLVDGRFGTDDVQRGRNPVYVAVPGSILRVKPVAFERQIENLLRQKRVDDALELLENTTDPRHLDAKRRRFDLDAGRVLFLDLKIADAMHYLTRSFIDPRELIGMFPELQTPTFRFRPTYFNASLLTMIANGRKSASDAATPAADAPYNDGAYMGDTPEDSRSKVTDATPRARAAAAVAAAGAGGAGGGAGAGAASLADMLDGGADMHVPDMHHIVSGIMRRSGSRMTSSEKVTIDAAVQDARMHLLRFLEDRRHKASLLTDVPELHEAIDTALLKLYAFRRLGATLDEFASSPNKVHMEDARVFLLDHKLYHVLALLYRSNGQARKALEVWRMLGEGRYVEGDLNGVPETVDFLSKVETDDQQELVYTFAAWVLRKDYEQGMRIFTADRRNPLPPDVVLNYLRELGLQTSRLRTIYLEYLINKRHVPDEAYHTALAKEYLTTVLSLRGDTAEGAAPHGAERCIPGEDGGELGTVREKFVRHLMMSDMYNVDAMLTATEGTTLYEERVILFKKAGDHENALKLLVYQLSNPAEAETYCASFADMSAPAEENPFLILLRIYFADTERRALFREAALGLLRNNATRVSPAEVLRLLPADLPLVKLKQYLEQVVPHTAHRVREAAVVRSLYRYERTRVNVELVKQLQRSLLITKHTTCAVCGERIQRVESAEANFFAVYPNDTIVHTRCVKGDVDFDRSTNTKFTARR